MPPSCLLLVAVAQVRAQLWVVSADTAVTYKSLCALPDKLGEVARASVPVVDVAVSPLVVGNLGVPASISGQ